MDPIKVDAVAAVLARARPRKKSKLLLARPYVGYATQVETIKLGAVSYLLEPGTGGHVLLRTSTSSTYPRFWGAREMYRAAVIDYLTNALGEDFRMLSRKTKLPRKKESAKEWKAWIWARVTLPKLFPENQGVAL